MNNYYKSAYECIMYITQKKFTKAYDEICFLKLMYPWLELPYYLFGIYYMKQKLYDNALEYFQIALEKYSKHIPSLINIGYIYHIQNKYDKALEYYNIGLDIDPKNEKLLYNKKLINYLISIKNEL
jgi:tetratricopeptide (TPR) repeat protein